MCLVVWLLHPFIWGTRRGRWLCRPGPWRAFAGAGQVTTSWRRQVCYFPLPRFTFREVMGIRSPLATRGSSIPRTPLLVLKVLVLPTVPAAAVLPALALVHGERVDVIHHALFTVRASHIHSLSQHHRSAAGAGTRNKIQHTRRSGRD